VSDDALKTGEALVPGESRQAKGGFPITYDDAGRARYSSPDTRDCGIRAVAIVTGREYPEVRDAIITDLATRKVDDESVEEALRAKTVLNALGPDWKYRRDLAGERRFHRSTLPPHRTMIVFIDDHFSSIVDGHIRDTGDHSGTNVNIHGYFYRPRAS
jgi:hypothetical protein